MGYDLHITRREHWSDEGEDISLAEWTAFVEDAEDMRIDGFADATAPNGETLRIEAEGMAVWTGFAGSGVDGNEAWFMPSRGVITVKNPSEEIIRKMIEIADVLAARVQGDEGEFYTRETFEVDRSEARPKSPWWMFWK